MKRTSLLVAVLVVVGMLVVPATGVLAQETDDESEADDVSPGERFSGVVGVQSAEFDGEVERNAYRIALERADDNATKASHIAEKLNETERRLAELTERKAQLQEQRENGEITEGQYRARTARMAAEVETAKKQLNRSNATAAELPAETLEANGVNVTAIRTLQNDASELSGPEVSEIARSIAGDQRGIADRGESENRSGAGDRDAGDDRRTDAGDTERGDGSGDEETADAETADAETADSETEDGDDSEAQSDSGSQDRDENGSNAGDR